MDERYNVYFAGQVIDGFEPGSVRDKLAKLFKADQATLDKLFSGNAQLIKRDCDKATALQYKQAMERAGAVPLIKRKESDASTAQSAPTKAMTAAEKIAALAAAPDATLYRPGNPGAAAAQPDDPLLAPPGTEVLRENERAQQIVRQIDTSGLAIDTAAKRLSDERPAPPAAPDTRHLSMAEAGETIPNLSRFTVPLSPVVEDLALSAPGTDFSDCAAPDVPELQLDLSALAVLPAGSALLEEQYRNRQQSSPPSTDHISLQD